MTDRDRTDDAYTGRAGQQAFIAQVLLRFGNAAVPVVDVGTDVLVFSDALDLSARVQVKTAKLVAEADGGHSAQFNLPLDQLMDEDVPSLYYALVTRDADTNTFPDVIIVPRGEVLRHWEGEKAFGTLDRKNKAAVLTVQLYHRVILGAVCGEVELTAYRNGWHLLPPLAEPSGQAAAGVGVSAAGAE